jgi:hypothetical protein
MIRRIFLCVFAMCAMGMSVMAVLPPHDPAVFQQSPNEIFSGSGYQAFVTSTVYELGPAAGGYLYTYQISGATTKFTWFSVALNPGTSIIDWNSEAPGTMPFAWEPVEDQFNPSSIEAFFKTGLTSGDSALLWFTSQNKPEVGLGALAKLSVTGGAYAEGLVLVPQVPEPMTAALLGLGWLAVRSYRRKG